MLETLRIQNYALIDEIEVDFGPGFNALTGETGAGKSIIAGALNLVLGSRASSDTVRSGADTAKVEALFRIENPSRRLKALLAEHALELEDDGALLLARVVTAKGRSKAYAAGSMVPVSVLADLGDELVDLHGQHEHQSLLKADRQLELLDAFAETEALCDEVADLVTQWRRARDRMRQLESQDREETRRLEFLRFEADEIDAAHLEPGEEEELKSRRNLLTNSELIFSLAGHAYEALYGGEDLSAVDAVDAALGDIEELAGIEDEFRPLREQLLEARAILEGVAGEVRRYTGEVEFDPEELEQLNERLAAIGALKRKYGESIEAILAYRDKAREELDAFDSRDRVLADLRRREQELCRQAEERARKLSDSRKATARKLDKKVTKALQDLGMKGGRYETAFEHKELGRSGLDRVEFLLAANPGESLKPLRTVASGGEISRIMLALKSVFAGADRIPTLVFDEIDAGVGGSTAKKVAAKLAELAASHQTLCITHLAQIAAIARTHYHVSKSAGKDRAAVSVTRVEQDRRIQELARLLDGSLTDVSLDHARALLEESELA